MTSFRRWCRFNLVGAGGMLVQLCTLGVLHRWVPTHYLWDSAVAVEVTLLHNFGWHQRYTWHDRPDGSSVGPRLVRFHLSNGLVSMVGNLVLMRVLVQGAHVPVLIANVIAIICCSFINFGLSDRWAFAQSFETCRDLYTRP